MKVKIDPGAFVPTRAHDTDAGLDLYSMEEKTIPPVGSFDFDSKTCALSTLPCSAVFDTGVHIAFDPGTYGRVEGRSGLNIKNSVVVVGSGIVDNGYRGSIKVKLYNLGTEPYSVHKGDRIAQLVIANYVCPKIEIVSHLDETERGGCGFGSTGK